MRARSASGGTGSERGARAVGDPPLFSIINVNIPQMSDRERLGSRQAKLFKGVDRGFNEL